MDEIDFLKKIFKIISITYSVITCCILFYVIRVNADVKVILYTLIICGGFYAFSIILYYFIKLILINQVSIGYLKNKEIDREILNNYPPAIYSFLYNKKIESYTDFTATILNLEYKKYLKINSNGYNITVLNENLEDLYEHEKYVMKCIMRNEKFHMIDFNKKVIKDLLKLDLINLVESEENKVSRPVIKKIENVFGFIVIIAFILMLIIYLVIAYLKVMTIILGYLCFLLIISFYVRNFYMITYNINSDEDVEYQLTKKGKNLRKYVFGLKKFFREYTLMNEREIEQKELYDNYIAYALSLGEAKIVEKFASSNEKYRTIIYKRNNETKEEDTFEEE